MAVGFQKAKYILSGRWLLFSISALSACDTGAGEAKAREGMMGLRRGFIQSGARNLTTVQIMTDF